MVRAAGWIFYLLRGGAGCGPGYVKICGAGCGPNDTVAGRVRAQLFQPSIPGQVTDANDISM